MTMRRTTLLDSGAFSAWSIGGTKLDVRAYTKFIKCWEPDLAGYINLDVIPGNGIAPDEAAEASYRNLQVMKDSGLRPLPVFHQGESFRWLDRMLLDNEAYICISPKHEFSPRRIRPWLEQVFSVIGNTQIDVHGLGVTSLELVADYRWTSVDSSTWALQAGYGKIVVPRCDARGRPDYRLPPLIYSITDDATSGRHVDVLGVAEIERVRHRLRDGGFTLQEARYSPEARYTVWAQYFQNMVSANSSGKIYFATGDSTDQDRALTRAGAKHQLASYWWLRTKSDDAVASFLAGQTPSRARSVKPRKADWRKGYRAYRARSLHLRFAGYDASLH